MDRDQITAGRSQFNAAVGSSRRAEGPVDRRLFDPNPAYLSGDGFDEAPIAPHSPENHEERNESLLHSSYWRPVWRRGRLAQRFRCQAVSRETSGA
jgi:hypothetical protein